MSTEKGDKEYKSEIEPQLTETEPQTTQKEPEKSVLGSAASAASGDLVKMVFGGLI
jgi:hypothetical protein